MTTRQGLIRQKISEAVSKAFAAGAQRASDGSDRPTLTDEDCEHIAVVADSTADEARLGRYAVRTIHGGRR